MAATARTKAKWFVWNWINMITKKNWIKANTFKTHLRNGIYPFSSYLSSTKLSWNTYAQFWIISSNLIPFSWLGYWHIDSISNTTTFMQCWPSEIVYTFQMKLTFFTLILYHSISSALVFKVKVLRVIVCQYQIYVKIGSLAIFRHMTSTNY